MMEVRDDLSARSLHHFGERSSFVPILQVFADDSSDRKQSQLLTVGGIYGVS